MGIKAKILKELQKKPRRLKELKAKLGNDKKVARAVDELVERNKVVCRKGVYAVPDPKTGNAVECTLVKLAGKFGFARPVQPDGQDIFIPGKYLMGAMPGDTLLVSLFEHPRVEGSSEGEVLAVVKENNRFTGTVETIEGRLALVPDACPHCPIYIKKSADGGARDGEKAAVEILERGDSHEDHRAGVAMRFGSAEEAKQCAKALLYGAGLSRHFPLKAKAEAKKYEGAAVGEKEAAGRRDYRGMPVFTIDSAETKDIDDAISLEKTDTGYRLGVHIADVSHYVRPGSALDAEAFARGTSVYYADSVIPMLPRQLSNGICSLNEGVLRLAFSCLMRLDKDGNLTDYRFVKSVIRSRVKGVYSEINALLAGSTDDELTGKYHEVLAQLPAMKELYGHRARLRKERGCMDIESGEVKLILDEDGHCIDVKKRTSGESEAMIEEFMLLANQCAAHFARVKQIPFVYRVHEEPNAEKLERLHGLLQACGVNDHFAKDVPTPKELSAILEGVRGTAYEQIINVGMLRCMSKAVYEEKPKGHYGLVLQDYAHFTSPIRRYPDLAIHRIMTAQLKGTDKDTMILRYSEFAEDVSKQASEREVIAMQIERKAEDCYKAEYARRHLGECYEGRISGVTQRGLFIELENGVEGFVPASSLTATGTMLTEGVRLSDPVSGKNWNLGDTMMITIVRADVNLGKIDFEVAPESAKQ